MRNLTLRSGAGKPKARPKTTQKHIGKRASNPQTHPKSKNDIQKLIIFKKMTFIGVVRVLGWRRRARPAAESARRQLTTKLLREPFAGSGGACAFPPHGPWGVYGCGRRTRVAYFIFYRLGRCARLSLVCRPKLVDFNFIFERGIDGCFRSWVLCFGVFFYADRKYDVRFSWKDSEECGVILMIWLTEFTRFKLGCLKFK